MKTFTTFDLKKLWKPDDKSTGGDNGQITIIGGSSLFHGAPFLAIKAASRTVDMVFFGSPEESLGEVAAKLKSQLGSFIWVPWDEVEAYVSKSEAILIGPGFMRFHSEKTELQKRVVECDEVCQKTTEITKRLLLSFPEKKWVIDGGSLQVLDPEWIPRGAILTPNKKEFEMLFGTASVEDMAKKFNCVICDKGPVSYISDGELTYEVAGGNDGLTKGGTGDTLAGMTVGFLAKNKPLLSAAAASLIVKKTAEYLHEKVGYNFNADDVAENCFLVLRKMLK